MNMSSRNSEHYEDVPNLSHQITAETRDFEVKNGSLLTFKRNSMLRPRNWSKKKKIIYTVMYSFTTTAVQFNSTTMSTENYITLMRLNFHVGRTVSLLGTSLYLFGMGFGPMVFAPVSEMFGRKVGVLIPFSMSGLFTLATSISYDITGAMISRFFAGVCAGAPIICAGAVIADIWDPTTRGSALGLYACFVATGPSLGPTISSLLVSAGGSKLDAWRIPLWFIALLEVGMFLVYYPWIQETYEPVILTECARRKRIAMNEWQLHSFQETYKFDPKEIATVHLIRPFAMLMTPIVLLMALYASYVFALFYLFITNVPTAFTIEWGWTGTQSTLPLIALFLGVVSGAVLNMQYSKRLTRITASQGGSIIPEQRLPILMWLAPALAMGVFVFSWTCTPKIHWIVPCIGIYFIGIGYIGIFQGCLNYLVDCFPKYSASAIAANTFLRSILSAAFPLFAKQLFEKLGVSWGGSLIGFIALLMVPIPFYFYKFGAKIRKNSPYAKLIE